MCGSGLKYKKCHADIDERIAAFARAGCAVPARAMLKSRAQIDGIRESGKRNAAVLDEVAARIRAGMTTAEIDRIVDETTRKLGGIPAPLGYQGFPKSVCTSVNDQVCHGIPLRGGRARGGRHRQRRCFHDLRRLLLRFLAHVHHRRDRAGGEAAWSRSRASAVRRG